MQISKAKVKLISSLQDKKQRREYRLFTVEGTKSVMETLEHFKLHMLAASTEWYDNHEDLHISEELKYSATHLQLKQMSTLSTAPDVIAVYTIPDEALPDADSLKGKLTLLLDDIQDPGNLGTIVRCADWFGIKHIIASPHTVDIFNPKTVQATMGALGRVNVSYTELDKFIRTFPAIPVVGMLLDGDNIYNAPLPNEAFIVMGNEGNGITESVRNLISHGLLIPSYPPGDPTVESLNVAMATAITLSEFRRRGTK